MSDALLTAADAAKRLGMSVATLYDWLGQSDRGLLIIRGQRVTIDYLQSGAKGQGRIQIEPEEVLRLKELLRVRPQPHYQRRPPVHQKSYPGITVPLGTPTGVSAEF
jgi:hypothetical protein